MKIKFGTLVLAILTLAAIALDWHKEALRYYYAFLSSAKSSYTQLIDTIESGIDSYFLQQQTIERLRRENRQLQQNNLKHIAYIDQLESLFDIMPELRRYNQQEVALTRVLSYVRLGTLTQFILTKPDRIKPDTLYGLVENDTVAGIAMLQQGRLIGYLLSDPKCRFAVFVGDKKATGIAEGMGDNRMIVRYIPKWYDIKVGDTVVTSGLDRIFMPSLPVGVVESVQTQSAYKTATVRAFADLYHPKVLFLLLDTNQSLPSMTIGEHYATPNTPKPFYETNRTASTTSCISTESNRTLPDANETNSTEMHATLPDDQDTNTTNLMTTSQPEPTGTAPNENAASIIQTRDDLIEPEPPIENKPPKPQHKAHRKKHRKHVRPSPKPLDLF